VLSSAERASVYSDHSEYSKYSAYSETVRTLYTEHSELGGLNLGHLQEQHQHTMTGGWTEDKQRINRG
jgi:hypothetical protein